MEVAQPDGGHYTDKADEVILELAGLDAVHYDLVREQQAERLGIRVSTLDSEVAKRRGNGKAQDLQGRSTVLSDPEPWPQRVDGAELLDELASTFTRHLTLPPGASTALAAWVVFTHAHNAFQVSPLLG